MQVEHSRISSIAPFVEVQCLHQSKFKSKLVEVVHQIVVLVVPPSQRANTRQSMRGSAPGVVPVVPQVQGRRRANRCAGVHQVAVRSLRQSMRMSAPVKCEDTPVEAYECTNRGSVVHHSSLVLKGAVGRAVPSYVAIMPVYDFRMLQTSIHRCRCPKGCWSY